MNDLNCIRNELWEAGWSAGETGGEHTWLVVATKGTLTVHASGRTQTEAWQSVLDLTGLGGDFGHLTREP